MNNPNDLLDDVANYVLTKCLEKLALNDADNEHLSWAQAICHEQRDNPAVVDNIAAYTRLADSITGGEFSAALQSWVATKH